MRKNYAFILFILASFVCVPPSGAQTAISTNNVVVNLNTLNLTPSQFFSVTIQGINSFASGNTAFANYPVTITRAQQPSLTNGVVIFSNTVIGVVPYNIYFNGYSVISNSFYASTNNFGNTPDATNNVYLNAANYGYVSYWRGMPQFVYLYSSVTNISTGGSGGIGAVNTNNFSTNGAVLDFSPTVQNLITNSAQQGAGSTVTFGVVNAGGVFQNGSNYNAGYGGAGSLWNGFSTSGTNILDPNGVSLRSAGGGGNSSFATNATYAVQATNLAGIATGSIVTTTTKPYLATNVTVTPEQFGGIADGQKVSDVRYTNGSPEIWSPSGPFKVGDVGKGIALYLDISNATYTYATITNFVDSQHVIISTNMPINWTVGQTNLVSNSIGTNWGSIHWGTDNTPAWQAALDAIYTNKGGTLQCSLGDCND